jgi:hypothetical protein
MACRCIAVRTALVARFAVILVVGSIGAVRAQVPSSGLPDQTLFLQQVRTTLQNDWPLQRRYTYREKRTELRLNDEHAVVGRSVKVFEVSPAPAGDDTLRRLLSVDGLPVDRERIERVRHEPDDGRNENDIIDDAFRLYDFHIAGREQIDGHDAIAFTFAPGSGVTPRTSEGKMLQKFSGRAWVSERDHQLIRVEVVSTDVVSMGFGLLARLDKGSQVVFQRRQVDAADWLPAEIHYTVGGRVLLLKKLRVEAVREYSDYRAFRP